jgi:hypothetical protein
VRHLTQRHRREDATGEDAAYSAEDDRLFRRNVTGYCGRFALAVVSTLVGHDQSRFCRF